MNEPSLFDVAIQQSGTVRLVPATQSDVDKGVRGRARRNDPQTSVQAAEKISGRTERLIMELFEAAWPGSGYTDDEIAFWLRNEAHGPTVKSARSRLSKAGRLVKSGDTRPSNTGTARCVWVKR